MNLSARLSGLFGTAVFLLTAMPGFLKQIQPYDFGQMATETISGVSVLETLVLSLGGAIGAGIIGYTIGDILTHPDTRRSKKKIYVKKEIKEFTPTMNQYEVQPDSPLYEVPPEVPAPEPSSTQPRQAPPPQPPPVPE